MRIVGLSLVLAAALALMPASARASSAARPLLASSPRVDGDPLAHAARSNGHCGVGETVLSVLNPFSSCQPLHQVAKTAAHAVTSIPGTLAGDLATGIMDQVTAWMVQAAQTISGWVVKEAGAITHPDLDASWYLNLFSGLAALGGALAGLVGLIALASAAIRRDPEALGEVIYGVARAGIGTSIVIALTIIGLGAADAIANDFARQMPSDFYKTLADQWNGSGFGGFGAAALAFLVAFVATIAGLLVWLELIVREAAIYIAVLFFPIGLAASIWPALRSWVRRLSMLLLMFVMLRPVVVIVLALAGSVTASGLSFGNGSIPHSVGTILAGVVVFALAAFTPWSLMFLLGTEIGVMHSRSGGSSGAGGGRGSSGSERAGGGVATAPMLASGGEPAMAGTGADRASSGGGGMRLSSLGGSGSGGASSGGSIAAAAGWAGAAAGAAGRVGGQLSQHAAARIHVASGRSGVSPGGILPPSAGGLDGGRGSQQTRTADPEPPPPASSSRGSSFADSVSGSSDPASGSPDSADPPSPVDSAVPPSSPSATESFGASPAPPATHGTPGSAQPPPPSSTSPPDPSDEPPRSRR